MAMINCPECGKEISSQANNCPHCGYPISERTNGVEGKILPDSFEIAQTDTSTVSKQSKGCNPKLFILLACVVIAIVAIAIYFLWPKGNPLVGTWETEKMESGIMFSCEFSEGGDFKSAFIDVEGNAYDVIEARYSVSDGVIKVDGGYGATMTFNYSLKGKTLMLEDLAMKKGSKKISEYPIVEEKLTEDEENAIDVCNDLKSRLKNPSSLQLNSVVVADEQTTYQYYIFVDYSAQNGFGGTTRSVAVYRNGKYYTNDSEKSDHYKMALSDLEFCKTMGYPITQLDVDVIANHLN